MAVATHTPHFPRPLRVAAGLMLGAALLLAFAWRWAGLPATVVLDEAPPTVWRQLRFADAADGAVLVSDARSGKLLERAQGEQGFLRGVLRGLAQERLRRGLPREAPFELQASAAGRLLLHDPSTGRSIDLESFGRDNALVFARWVAPKSSIGAPGATTPTITTGARP
jgi:putative photosynthetic complex assembly protein